MRPLFNWLRRRRLENDLDRELRYHLDRRTLDLQRSGLTGNEARRKARLELGAGMQVEEEVRDVWLNRWLRDFAYDLRFSIRSFKRMPGFTLTAVVSLMLGIGATTAIYSLLDQVLLHALPVREPRRLVLFDWNGEDLTHGFGSWNLMSYPICRDLDQQKQFFEGVFCRALTTVNLSIGGYSPEETAAEVVSGNYFRVLGVTPAMGRVLAESDDGAANSNPVVVISYGFWKSRMGGASDAVGRKLLMNGHPLTIVGVAAPSFQGIDVGMVPSLWIPASMASEVYPWFSDYLDRRTVWMQVLGRLKDGVTLKQARVGLQPWFQAMLREDSRRAGFPVITPQTRKEYFASTLALTAAPSGHSALRRDLAEPLWVLFGVTAVLLGLACLNVAGLFLARGSAREREISTRVALGASRGRVGRQLLADSLLIALTGGLLGTVTAPLVVRLLLTFLPRTPATVNALHASLDPRLLLFALAVSVTTGVLSGLAPAWQAGSRSIISPLRDRVETGGGKATLRKFIVTAQIALTLLLVACASLFIRTLDALTAKGPGFATTSLVSFIVNPMNNGYSDLQANRLLRRLDEMIRNSPITGSSALVQFPLLTGGSWNERLTVQGRRRAVTDDIDLNAVTPAFLKTLNLKLLKGRNFNEHDSRPPGEQGGPRSAIVNEAFVKRYLPAENPLGVLICHGVGPNAKPDIPIVGVVSNFSYRDLRGASEQAFFPFLEQGSPASAFYVKVRTTPEQAMHTLANIVHQAGPELPLTRFAPVAEQVNESLNIEHLLATLSSGFGIVALLLSLVGLYGVMAFVVSQRTREIGVRLALGAKRASTIWLVLRDASCMTLGGIAIGLPAVWALGRLIASELFGVTPSDPLSLLASALILCLASLSASFIPARRAAKVNPADALRAE